MSMRTKPQSELNADEMQWRRQECAPGVGNGMNVHEIRQKLGLLHKYNKLTLSQLKRL